MPSISVLFLLSFALLAPVPPRQPLVSEEILVTASALPEEAASTPASATVITRDEIDERAASDVAEVLREVPGLVLSRTGSAGRATSLFTRGSNSTHTLVLWNGIEITNPYFAGYDWGRFSTVGVEQVEVVRGPFSALYGSDAVAGVVNVLTVPSRSAFRASFESGGNGWRNASGAASLVRDAATLSVSFESRSDDGFEPNDDFSQNSANAVFRWNATDTLSLGLTARHTKYDLGIPKNLNAAGDALVPSPNRRQEGTERQLAIPIAQTLGRFSWELTLAESRRDDDFLDPDDPYFLTESSTESSTRRARLTTRSETSFGMIVAGGEYERAEVDDLTNFGPNLEGASRDETSFFLEDRFSREIGTSGRLELAAGARLDDYDTFGSEISPRFSAAWINGGTKWRAGYGEAFRAPAVGELYYPFMGNVDLGAERSRTIEVGVDRATAAGQLSATLFRSDYDGLIVFDLSHLRFENIGRANARGLELSLSRDLSTSLHANATYTLMETEEEGFDRPLLRRPKHSGSLFVRYRTGSFESGVAAVYTGNRADVLAVAPFSRTTNEAHTVLDANVQFDLGRVTPYLKVENLTDVAYEEVLGYASPGRRVIIGVKVGR